MMLLDLFSLIVGGIIGAMAGFMICGLMVMAAKEDERMGIK